jgi:hypothetical protein
MLNSILKRFPGLKEDDVRLRCDVGGNVYIDVWNSTEVIPSMDEVLAWVEEDKTLPIPLTETEVLKKQVADLAFELMIKGVL